MKARIIADAAPKAPLSGMASPSNQKEPEARAFHIWNESCRPVLDYRAKKNSGERRGIRTRTVALADRHPVANHYSAGHFHASLGECPCHSFARCQSARPDKMSTPAICLMSRSPAKVSRKHVRDHSHCRAHSAVDRRLANLAIQRRLGLLSWRRVGADPDNRCCLDLAGSNIGDVQSLRPRRDGVFRPGAHSSRN
jgi:hypothetical protein